LSNIAKKKGNVGMCGKSARLNVGRKPSKKEEDTKKVRGKKKERGIETGSKRRYSERNLGCRQMTRESARDQKCRVELSTATSAGGPSQIREEEEAEKYISW